MNSKTTTSERTRQRSRSRTRSRSPRRKSRRHSRSPSPKRNSHHTSPRRSRYYSDKRHEEKENYNSRSQHKDRKDKFSRGNTSPDDSSPEVVFIEEKKNNCVKSSINNAILQEMVNIDDDDDDEEEEEKFGFKSESNDLDMSVNGYDENLHRDNDSEIDIMESTDTYDIKKELEENLHKKASSVKSSPGSNSSDNKNKTQTAVTSKRSLRMQNILDKATGVNKGQLAINNNNTSATVTTTKATTTSTSSSISSSLNKNEVAHAVVKPLTKYLNNHRIKDRVGRSIHFILLEILLY